jgi:hypothetical protein
MGKGLKSGAVDFEHGANKAEVCSFIQRATIPSKRVVYTLKYSQNTTHAIIDNTCLVLKVKYVSPLQVKIKPLD